jgi:DNA (cytosine-5)-methyltransferase 1
VIEFEEFTPLAPRPLSPNGGDRPTAKVRCSPDDLCAHCSADQAFLRSKSRPQRITRGRRITAVDLFAGCGGMSVGLGHAAQELQHPFSVILAMDVDAHAVGIYQANVSCDDARTASVESVFDGEIGAALTGNEELIAAKVGRLDFLIGGPPCQGHSDLNNHTRRRDPKNALYSRMARAAQVLMPTVVAIENVSSVQWDEGKVVQATTEALEASGYEVASRVLNLARIGVPQRRERFVLLGSSSAAVDPASVLDELEDSMPAHDDRTVEWAIGDLLDINANGSVFDTSSKATEVNRKRMQYLFEHGCHDLPNDQRPVCHQDGEHSYNSVYGRLWWHKPAQTITTGFGCMGQGRYVHPQRRRTITPHEAARLQTFPDWFDFGQKTRRGVLAKAIGNAVPPFLTMQLGRIVIPTLPRD